MKIQIQKIEHKRIEKTIEVDVPDKQMFIWHNGIRKAYSVTPVWTTWNKEYNDKPEEIYELKVVMVDPSDTAIELRTMRVSDLPNIADSEKHPYKRLIENILEYPDDKQYLRTKEQFMQDLNGVMEAVNKGL